MYIKEVTEVDKLIFSENPPKKPNYKKAEKMFGDEWKDILLPEPPKNSSRQTMDELQEIAHRQSMLSEFDKKVYKNTDKDTAYYVKQYLDEQDLEWDEDVAEDIMDTVKHIGRHYKNHFNRPRPYQVAEKLGVEIDDMETTTVNSPAYPSNHALQARMVALYYGDKFPAHKKYLLRAADMSAEGRVNAGVHYPSDKQVAYLIADTLFDNHLKKDMVEDAPVNSTGSAVATDQPLVRSRSKYTRRNKKDAEGIYRHLRTYF